MEMAEKKRAVIFAGAPLSDHSFFTAYEGDYYICADRGYLMAKALGIRPDILLGDFDSLGEPIPSGIPYMQFPAEKDETDLQLAIDHAISRGFAEVYVLGAFGGRVDHFLGNIALMRWALSRGAVVIMENADTFMRLVEGEAVFPKRENRYFSVIPFFGDAVVSISGTKYTAERAKIALGDTLGISNEITEAAAKITVHEGCALVLQCKADAKLST